MTKYRARRTKCRHGHVHHSAKEARRCNDLHLLQKAGEISDLEAGPAPFVFEIGGQRLKYRSGRAVTYFPDFAYREAGESIVEDCKGVQTPAFKIKSALMMACHGIEVRLT